MQKVGKELDYDSLKLDVYTNGSMTAENAVRKSAEILIAHLVLFEELNKEPDAVKKEEKEKNSGEQKQEAALGMEIDELELSARSSNCLKKAGIATVAELIAKNPDELVEITPKNIRLRKRYLTENARKASVRGGISRLK